MLSSVLDLDMPGLDGLAVLREAARVCPQTRTVILTRHMEEPYAVEALRIGARGYVLKTQASTDLVAAIRHVDRGEDVGRGDGELSPHVGGSGFTRNRTELGGGGVGDDDHFIFF